ncbi:hypothetical protein I3843_03G106000 [Carya illinoinensis]|nr:hypothetical protein I3843_03G106000 [Carya illinoinensis]
MAMICFKGFIWAKNGIFGVLTSTTENSTAPIGIKLDGSNYALWSQVVEMYIYDKDKLGFINDDCPPPSPADPSFQKWHTDNAIVKASSSLEKFYTKLQGLWREIDFPHPNLMECTTNIHHYNNLLQEDRVYTFLYSLDDHLDNIRSDVLQMCPFPSIEQAYAHVRREALRQAVMSAGDPNNTSGVVLATKGLKLSSTTSPFISVSSQPTGKSTAASKSWIVPDGTRCSHCGN